MIDIVERLRTEETDLFRLQETAADTIESLHRQVDVWRVRVEAHRQASIASEAALAASQAREAQLREHLVLAVEYGPAMAIGNVLSKDVLAIPQDDTALKQYGAKLLRDAAERLGDIEAHDYWITHVLRRMADELEGKK